MHRSPAQPQLARVAQPPQADADEHHLLRRARKCAWYVVQHATKHTGVGIVCAVAYFDPGNWGVDLQAGSEFGYKLLFVVLLAGIFAIVVQTMASRLGCVTGLDLASHCRILLYNRPKHTKMWRWMVLYPLYALSEIAIISTDLAELLGSAIALCMLFPKLPLWGGVLLTASDVFILLALRDPMAGKPVRVFELCIAALVFIVLICMAVIISKASVQWGDAFFGFVPSKTVIQSNALYTSIGIIGATVMPHSLFLGSALATQDRVDHLPDPAKEAQEQLRTLDSVSSASSDSSKKLSLVGYIRAGVKRHIRIANITDVARPDLASHAEHTNRPYSFVRLHLYHGIVDMVISLLGLAVVINSMILILSSAVFFNGNTGDQDPASLFDAYDLLGNLVGKPAAILFALALLASGQSSSIIATLAGQIVSEGFIRWKLSPVMRRLVTRCIGLVPSLAVAAAVGRSGIDTLLVASQVILSIVLPFIVFPLVYLTSSRSIMSVHKTKKLRPEDADVDELPAGAVTPAESDEKDKETTRVDDTDAEAQAGEMVDFSNGYIVTGLGYLIWLVVVVANVYAIVGLALGDD
ncbi:natural resistance-associated macrophage protein [Trametes versicolor FP-101664 SS1]|uniref:natural resistance-associated macrophage protein n=1 Tax=Trametes versicolor (strain FP-101664) TaxID=717944 RepID=UPI00046234B8|nr:natural resistance-associated macrophage protein [Trametes versicolor FP-101664 SS1]EIW64452.1 natural resistance-associated macrophage protein [Trametes versicolor FP-101664 SS1]